MRVLFLDIDGVLNRTGYRPDESHGLRSWIEPELAQRLCEVINAIDAEIALSSDWRRGRERELLRSELQAAGIGPMIDVTAEIHGPRWREIEAWMTENGRTLEQIAIANAAMHAQARTDRGDRFAIREALVCLVRGLRSSRT